LLSQRDTTQSKIGKLEETQIELEEKIDSYDEDKIDEGLTEYTEAGYDLTLVENNIEKHLIKSESLNERKDHLDSHKYNEECDICMENSQTILEQKEKVEGELETIKSELKEFENTHSELVSKRKELAPFEKQYENLKKLKEDENKVSRDINILINKLSTFETQEIKINGELVQVTQLIEDYLENEKQIQKNKELRAEMVSVRSELTTCKENVDTLNKQLLKLNGEVSSLKNQKKTIEDRIDEVEKLEEQFGLFEYYLNSLGKDGVSYELISKALPMIEGEVNNILGQIVEFGLQLEMDGKNINANIVYDDQKWSLEMCSGMEKFISGLAIRIALINVCNLPRPNFLVIDEGFGTLDNENLTSLYMLFAYLKTQFDFVMIISHIDSMRDVVDSLMEIKKVNGFSNIKF